MMVKLTDEELLRAERIIDGWYWQIDESRSFRYANALKTITRFYETAPLSADVMRLVIGYLSQQKAVREISLNNKLVDLGESYDSVLATYRTAEGQKAAGTESSKVRVYQTFAAANADTDGDGPYIVENGCKYKVTHVFHWTEPDMPDLPKSTSGVQWTVQGLTRDKETGYYSCVFEKRETLEQKLEKYTAKSDTFATVEEEAVLGVKEDDVANTGKAASASADTGTVVERQVVKNPDCTSDVRNVTTTEQEVLQARVERTKTVRGVRTVTADRSEAKSEAVEANDKLGRRALSEKTAAGRYDNTVEDFDPSDNVTVASSEEKDIFSKVSEYTVQHLKAPTDTLDPKDGKTYRRLVRTNDDGSLDVTTRTAEEINVKDAVKEERMTVRGKLVTVTEASADKAAQSPVAIGASVRNEKTPGGKFRTTSSSLEVEEGDVALSVTQSTYEVRKETQSVEKDWPTNPLEGVDLEGSGVVMTEEYRKNNDGGVDVVSREIVEKTVTGSEVTKRGLLRTTLVRVVDSNEEKADITGDDVAIAAGQVQQSVKTPGGAYNNILEKHISRSGFGFQGSQRRVGYTLIDTTVAFEKAGTIFSKLPNPGPPDNTESDISVQVNEDGVTQDRRTVTIMHVAASKTETWSDDNYDYVYCAYINQLAPLRPTDGEYESVSLSFAYNAHGTFNGSYSGRKVKKLANQSESLQWSKTNVAVSSYYYYHKKDGSFCKRLITGKADYYYGRTKTIIDKVAGGANCPQAGWKSGYKGNKDFAEGVKYYDIKMGGEEVIDGGGSST